MAHSEVAQKNTEASPISWSNATKETEYQKFKRKLTYARETISRKRSALIKQLRVLTLSIVTSLLLKRSHHLNPKKLTFQEKILITLPIVEADNAIATQIEHPLLSAYLKSWGFIYKKEKDQCYFDGHEREDVVDYRVKWSQKMMQWQKQMKTYPLDNENADPVQPNLKENEKKRWF